ncbi:hypothetical protein ABB37_00081 [Leptomonas pyrrhocoris]|uniref:Target of rapamycin (TOR) kinase 1 n=1 Tax=Leptomonas pyrrhocoris TaxID=157538 RepID=A0A0N0DQY7_LEPPY|nr:hypothetical protein ABB37_09904 [Leptomonas pyrrhocoris]XP_015652150.1 hypothetical protein ABB37_09631 [Leptomonas pyrrhocoris]XP_015652465.1 hypothetical protein ABB37_09581 [Leptomonas pyrrhocoris]XP_015652469.1 hypothetical protein ABB37_09585 [Leptomonas pyrrhocoris]XP_015652654.1 hypothetical protein ABB37_09466 [Leptomonas pyrrhocoris]XP_015653934.1 hypothetical protein ABB37_08393 [Leptomonas pyrrhocoris]XP_015659860.1 hypothetical protein ABB37_03791 [Leptomonas pyrrhocoris]XP_0|eukprot:XP_015651784.1 hypothetical protein ABB37_09904 [Leptomonas pyrrhocoris]
MKASAKARFDELWRLLSSPEQLDPGTSPLRTIFEGDARVLMSAGVLVPASPRPTRGWFVPFSVVEEKPSGLRRRFIAWPKEKNLEDSYEADVPLGHISAYLDVVWEEGASNLDLKASFYQVPLPEEARSAFRCRLDDGTLVELARLPMGYAASPELMQLLTSALAGVPTVVDAAFACPTALKIHVWIDNVRIAGPLKAVEAWTRRVTQFARDASVTIGESEVAVASYTFVGVFFDHATHTVRLGEKTWRHLRETPPFEEMTVGDLEVFTSRAIYGAAVLGVRLFRNYMFLKFVRRQLSSLNRGKITTRSKITMTPYIRGFRV